MWCPFLSLASCKKIVVETVVVEAAIENPPVTCNIYVCTDNFQPDCFKQGLQAQLMGTQARARLKANAVPTLLVCKYQTN